MFWPALMNPFCNFQSKQFIVETTSNQIVIILLYDDRTVSRASHLIIFWETLRSMIKATSCTSLIKNDYGPAKSITM